MSECRLCSGSGSVMRWEPVPYSELSAAQIAETMVNGGEYRRKVCAPCERCSP